jgi:acyl carrier protein
MIGKFTRNMIVHHLQDVLKLRFPAASGPDISMDNVPDWDSMAHVEVIVMLEKKFDLEASAGMVEARTSTELVDAVATVLVAEQRLIA